MPYIGNVLTDFNIGTENINNGAVTGEKLSQPFDYDSGTLYLDDTNNRVGLGTTSPDVGLHYRGDTPKLRIESSNNLEATAGTEEIGRIEWEGFKTSNFTVAASIRARQDGTWSTITQWNAPSALEFYTQNNTGVEVTSPRLTINSSGNVGIGTTAPGYSLHVNGNALIAATANSGLGSAGLYVSGTATSNERAINLLSVDGNGGGVIGTTGDSGASNGIVISAYRGGGYIKFETANIGSERARIDSSGRLLVGTTSTSNYNHLLQVRDNNGRIGEFFTANASASTSPYLAFSRSRGTTASPTVVSQDDFLGALEFTGYSGTAAAFVKAAGIYVAVDGQPDTSGDTTDMPGRIVFSTTADGASSPTERLRITSDGRVGIGTTSPATLLHIAADDPVIRLEDTAGGTQSDYEIKITTSVFQVNNVSTATTPFTVNNSGTTTLTSAAATAPFIANIGASEVARIDSSGRLLVGASSAQSVSSTGLTPAFQLNSTNSSLSSSTLGIYANSASNNCRLALFRNRATTAGGFDYTGGTVQTDDVLGQIDFYGVDASTTPIMRGGAVIQAVCESTPTTAEMPARLIFSTTADGGNGPTEQLRITSDRYIRLASGTGGIQFGGDTAAANALDDYEEGAFTPTVIGTSTAGTGTYGSQVGRYTKIGNRVIFNIYITWTAHTGTGNMDLSGLPFTTSSVANSFAVLSAWASNIALTAGNILQAYCLVNSSNIRLHQVPTGGGASVVIPLDAAGELMVSGSYFV
jgi:hypothetical protein